MKPQNFQAENCSGQLIIIKQVKHMFEKYAFAEQACIEKT